MNSQPSGKELQLEIEGRTRELFSEAVALVQIVKTAIIESPDFKGTRKQRRDLHSAEEALAVIVDSALASGISLYSDEDDSSFMSSDPEGSSSLRYRGLGSAETSETDLVPAPDLLPAEGLLSAQLSDGQLSPQSANDE